MTRAEIETPHVIEIGTTGHGNLRCRRSSFETEVIAQATVPELLMLESEANWTEITKKANKMLSEELSLQRSEGGSTGPWMSIRWRQSKIFEGLRLYET